MVKKHLKILAVLLVMLSFKVIPAPCLELVLATDNTPGDPYIMGGGDDFNRARPGIEIEFYQLVARLWIGTAPALWGWTRQNTPPFASRSGI